VCGEQVECRVQNEADQQISKMAAAQPELSCARNLIRPPSLIIHERGRRAIKRYPIQQLTYPPFFARFWHFFPTAVPAPSSVVERSARACWKGLGKGYPTPCDG